jgi:hypothetical protein
MLDKTFGYFNLLVELTQQYVAIEHDTVEVIGFEAFGYLYSLPVFRPADIIFQDLDLILC